MQTSNEVNNGFADLFPVELNVSVERVEQLKRELLLHEKPIEIAEYDGSFVAIKKRSKLKSLSKAEKLERYDPKVRI